MNESSSLKPSNVKTATCIGRPPRRHIGRKNPQPICAPHLGPLQTSLQQKHCSRSNRRLPQAAHQATSGVIQKLKTTLRQGATGASGWITRAALANRNAVKVRWRRVIACSMLRLRIDEMHIAQRDRKTARDEVDDRAMKVLVARIEIRVDQAAGTGKPDIRGVVERPSRE